MPSSRIEPLATAVASVTSAVARETGSPIAAISADERVAISAAVGNRTRSDATSLVGGLGAGSAREVDVRTATPAPANCVPNAAANLPASVVAAATETC